MPFDPAILQTGPPSGHQPDGKLAKQAAWANATFARLTIGAAPMTAPGPGEIVVRNHAVAVNPVDRYNQHMGNLMFGWIKYPCVLGQFSANGV